MSDNIISFKKGDIICKENEYELWFYEILSGSMTIYKNYGLSDQYELGKADSGYIGEMGFLNSMSRIGTVVADEDTTLAKIDNDTFKDYFISHPEKIYSIIQCLLTRLNEINDNFLEVSDTIRDCVGLYEMNSPISSALSSAMEKFSNVFRSRKAK
ncbi:MAG: cyclic nucleotide-binding domain-containing protein [Lachnospiraceae bacterium]|nr:cyclic nucleotide-binding domain-containing protein [Lachnospiraceae bacterium]